MESEGGVVKLDDNESSRRWTRIGLLLLGFVATGASVLLVLLAAGVFDDDANTKQNNVVPADEVALFGSASYDTSMGIEPSLIPATGSAPDGGATRERDARNPFSPR